MKYEALDIETIWDEGVARPISISISDGEEIVARTIKWGEDPTIIVNFMIERCKPRKIYYVHNLTFEIFVFLKYLVKEEVKFKITSSNKTVYRAILEKNGKRIEMRCSYRLTLLALKDLAKLAGIREKGVFPYKILNRSIREEMKIEEKDFNTKTDYEKFIEEYGELIRPYKILEEYCKNDTLITRRSIIKYWEIIESTGLKREKGILTAAKLSITNYFKANNVIKKTIPIKVDRALRPWYVGGRTEVFGNPGENELTLHYDWKGMYSQCMKEKVLGGEIIISEKILSLNYPGFYWIKFKQNMEKPVLPVKRNKLMFINGIFEGWYWFEEIKLAEEEGVEILEVKRIITAQYYDNFLEEFVKINEELRERGPLHKQIGKNNNNTFYGRLGMNPEREEEEIVSELSKENEMEKYSEINGIYVIQRKKEKTISNLTVSASITAKARIKLYRGMREVEKRGGRILYTDTDSIIASFNKDLREEIINTQMGEVYFDTSKEDTEIIDAVFAMPKTYALRYKNGKEIVKIKGFNVVPNFREFKKAFYGDGMIKTVNLEWSKKNFEMRLEERIKETNLHSLDKRSWDKERTKTDPIKEE